jgi:hypothetical protein
MKHRHIGQGIAAKKIELDELDLQGFASFKWCKRLKNCTIRLSAVRFKFQTLEVYWWF